MIQLTDINGRTHAIHPDAIARLVEPGTSGKWHGVNCYVRTFDGDTIEVRESVSEIMQTLAATEREAPRSVTALRCGTCTRQNAPQQSAHEVAHDPRCF